MAKKKTVVSEVASVLGAAAARVENLKPKRAAAAKHSKAKSAVPEPEGKAAVPIVTRIPELAAAKLVNAKLVDSEPVAAVKPVAKAKAVAAGAGSAVAAAPVAIMTELEEIRLVAYLYAERRGFQGGSEQEDWVRAEQEVRGRRAAARNQPV